VLTTLASILLHQYLLLMSGERKEWYLQPKVLFALFTCANTLLFIDRGIVPGAASEFNAFIKDSVDTSTPDVFLGLLQSAFIVGLAIGSSVFGHLVHHYGRFYLTGMGCTIWMLAVFLSGISRYTNSYAFLVFARMLSGVGEASLQVNIPPWVQKTAPAAERGIWLSVFYTAIPVGTATGYAYSSLMAENLGWEWAYFVEAIAMAPLVMIMFSVSPHFPVDKDLADFSSEHSLGGHKDTHTASYDAPAVPNNSRATSHDRTGRNSRDAFPEPSSGLQIHTPPVGELGWEERPRDRSTSSTHAGPGPKRLHSVELGSPAASADVLTPPGSPRRRRHHAPTVLEELGIVFSRPLFLCLVAGYAAQTAMLIGLSTFGSAFMMGLGYFDTESQSSTIFGGLICLSGVIATPLGGWVLDRMLAKATLRTQPQLSSQHFDSESALSGGAGEVVRNVVLEAELGQDLSSHEKAGGFSHDRSKQSVDDLAAPGRVLSLRDPSRREQPTQAAAAGSQQPPLESQDSPLLKRRKMDAIAQLITLSSVAGCLLLVMCYWLHDRFAFLALVTVGVGVLFFCTPAINMGFLLAVPQGELYAVRV
jgi:MFS family permease